MSLNSADGFVAGAPVGASSGAGPSLTSGAAYSTWAPLFLNYCTSIGLRDVLRKDIPKWKELCEAAEVWADETREALVDAALNGGPTAS